jgi:UDP:flavonoid glycosyltransferase YjiC (YdhE family)
VQEAIQAITPMIVIPEIAEQKIIAEKITSLGLGIELNKDKLSVNSLRETFKKVLELNDLYAANLRKLAQEHSGDEKAAAEIISNHLIKAQHE